MKEKLKGGVRKGAGRKPSPDPKQPVTMFVETSIIDALGGKEGVKGYLYSCLDLSDPEKKFPVSDLEIKQKTKKPEKRPIVSDLTKPTGVLKPQEQPKSNYSINTAPKNLDELKSRCPKELAGFERSAWISTERQKYGI